MPGSSRSRVAEALTQAEAVAAEAHRTFIRITQADKRREGRKEERTVEWVRS